MKEFFNGEAGAKGPIIMEATVKRRSGNSAATLQISRHLPGILVPFPGNGKSWEGWGS